MSAYFRPVILNAFPEHTWETLERCVAQGIVLADTLIREECWLDWAVGKDQRGDLRRVGAMWEIREACILGRLPFSCEDRKNTLKNCHHIEIISQNVCLHITRTESLRGMPRDTRMRNDERASNQLNLFKPVFTTDLSAIRKWYGWLTFNANVDGNITHLAIGLPESERNEWLDILPIPLCNASAFINEDEEPLPPGPDKKVRFREDIRKRLEAHEDDAEAQEGSTEDT